jgi:hypothetical protein
VNRVSTWVSVSDPDFFNGIKDGLLISKETKGRINAIPDLEKNLPERDL